MIELDLARFGGRDACDCVKRDIDHRKTLPVSLQRGVRLTLCGISSSIFSFAS
jgi:hypothetical protein